ncbi:probable purine permease 5 [Selaginella moellendorffii]|nr:probable purine permease 5 [Selaginella moellendorffii]|eukprot:XP_002973993.2 probable purine permease 5 [Selaginella moellendorffii]
MSLELAEARNGRCSSSHQDGVAAAAEEHTNKSKKNSLWSSLKRKSRLYWLMLALSGVVTVVSTVSAFLIGRFYFTQGGSRRWLSAWIQVAGWPLSASMLFLQKTKSLRETLSISRKLASAYVVLGAINGGVCLLYAWGISYLPASTSSILISTQLVFTSLFALVIVRKPLSPFMWNAVVLMTCSTVLVGLHSSSDKPPGLTHSQYILGFVMTLAAAVLFGLLIPLFELVTKNLMASSSSAVAELMTFVNIVATVVLSIGMAINGDFSRISAESRVFKSGRVSYFMTLFWSAVLYQVQYLSVTGVAMLASSLLSGILITASTPLVSIFAFFFFHDNLGGVKIMALVLSVWGFISYAYGGYLDEKSKAPIAEDKSNDREEV